MKNENQHIDFTLNNELLTLDECLMLMEKENLSAKIIRHSIKVALAAFRLANSLNIQEIYLQYPLVAGLLHDIKKKADDHPKAGEILLNSMSYKGLACAIATHACMPKIILEKMNIEHKDINQFAKLIEPNCIEDISCYYACICVYIADRFYSGDEFVTLEERFARFKRKNKDNAYILASIEERQKLSYRFTEWYKAQTGFEAFFIVNVPTNHSFEKELAKVFKKYL